MSITPLQRKISDAIECFENGKPNQYGGLVTMAGDTGGVSGGELMASLSSGNLGKLCRLYAKKGGVLIPELLIAYAEACNPVLNNNAEFKAAWKAAATDPLMASAQDEFFYTMFQVPAENWCKSHGFVTPLATLVIMDSLIHGALGAISKKVSPTTKTERQWIAEYVAIRRAWLAGYTNVLLQHCVGRMDTMLELISKDNWNLDGPINVHVGKGIVVVN